MCQNGLDTFVVSGSTRMIFHRVICSHQIYFANVNIYKAIAPIDHETSEQNSSETNDAKEIKKQRITIRSSEKTKNFKSGGQMNAKRNESENEIDYSSRIPNKTPRPTNQVPHFVILLIPTLFEMQEYATFKVCIFSEK